MLASRMVLHLISVLSLWSNICCFSCSTAVGAVRSTGAVGAGGCGIVNLDSTSMVAWTSPPFLNVALTCSDSFFKVVAYLSAWQWSEQSKICPLSASHAPWNLPDLNRSWGDYHCHGHNYLHVWLANHVHHCHGLHHGLDSNCLMTS